MNRSFAHAYRFSQLIIENATEWLEIPLTCTNIHLEAKNNSIIPPLGS